MTSPSLDDKALTVGDVAKIFAVRPYTVREWLKTDKLKGFKIPGDQWRVLQSEVTAFAQELYGEKK